MFQSKLFQGKRILVTGGGTGLGRAMTERFVQLGASCFICGRRQGVVEETAQAVMREHGGSVKAFGVDIRDAAADEEEIGKPVGRDLALGRPSAVIVLGLDGALFRLHDLVRGAIDAMPPCPNGAELRSLMLSEAKRLVPAKLAQFAA